MTRNLLTEMGCNKLRGFLVSRPLPDDRLEALAAGPHRRADGGPGRGPPAPVRPRLTAGPCRGPEWSGIDSYGFSAGWLVGRHFHRWRRSGFDSRKGALEP